MTEIKSARENKTIPFPELLVCIMFNIKVYYKI